MILETIVGLCAVGTFGFQVFKQFKGVVTKEDLDKQSAILIQDNKDAFSAHKADIDKDLKGVFTKLDSILAEAKQTNGRVRSLEDWRLVSEFKTARRKRG